MERPVIRIEHKHSPVWYYTHHISYDSLDGTYTFKVAKKKKNYTFNFNDKKNLLYFISKWMDTSCFIRVLLVENETSEEHIGDSIISKDCANKPDGIEDTEEVFKKYDEKIKKRNAKVLHIIDETLDIIRGMKISSE